MIRGMDRYWLLTSTFYGNWLPGDPRGFVSRVRDRRVGERFDRTRHEHDVPGTPYDADMNGLYRASGAAMRGAPVLVDEDQADCSLNQFHDTAEVRDWWLLASAVMRNHVHLVVGVDGDPEPSTLLGSFKAYGSRALSARWSKPAGGRWWTARGSTRKLADTPAVFAAVEYVRRQANPLRVWIDPDLLDDHPA